VLTNSRTEQGDEFRRYEVAIGQSASHKRRRLGQAALVAEIEHLAASTNLSVRQIQDSLSAKASRGLVGGLTKRVRTTETGL
jgi:hypothetical protein